MKYTFIIFTFFITNVVYAQQKSCCAVSNITMQNAALAMNNDFGKAHAEPKAFKLTSPKGEMIEFATAGGKPAKGYLLKTARKSKKYLFIYHEFWGLNDYIKKEAEKYFADLKDVNVLAIDLYDGNVADNREDAMKYMGAMTDMRTRAIVNGALAFAGKRAHVATLGWCLGGSWSLQTAIEGGSKVDACVMYYGFPEMNVTKLKQIDTDILGIFGEKDQYINPTTIKEFEGKVKEAGKEITVFNYVADHAFANPSNPNFNEQATKDAYENKVLPYLKKKLKIKG